MSTPSNYRARRKKTTKEESEFDDGDLISKLPDPLLHHIFSFLDMKFVIQTSILSRRWRYLWISQPIMNFNREVHNPFIEASNKYDYRVPNYKYFMDFVGKALFQHGTSKIHTFRLSGSYKGYFAEYGSIIPLDVWMPVLDRRKVEVIDLQIDRSGGRLELPGCLFRCRTLTVLKLDLGPEVFENVYNLPDCGFRSPLPSLKTLHLRSFSLESSLYYNSIQDFLSNCPVLETLVISNCSVGYNEVKLQHEQLKKLVIEAIDRGRLRVIAPNLESFSCRGDPINDYCFENIRSLVKADIDTDLASKYYSTNLTPPFSRTYDSQHVMECLRGLSNVRSLMLSAWLLEITIEFPDFIVNLPMKPFYNLRSLTLKTSLSKCQILATTNLLEKCPKLETLVVKMTKLPLRECVGEAQSNAEEEKEGWEAELAPVCQMFHLKVVKIWDVEGAKNEFEFLRFLLKNALVLEKVVVYTSKTQSPNNNMELKRFGEKLTTLPGVSSRIGIFLLYLHKLKLMRTTAAFNVCFSSNINRLQVFVLGFAIEDITDYMEKYKYWILDIGKPSFKHLITF